MGGADAVASTSFKIAGAASGAYVGGLVGGSVIGGRTGRAVGTVGGGIGGMAAGGKMANFLARSRAEGATGEYGIDIATKNCNATVPVLRFDFLKTAQKPIARAVRTSSIYKKNVEVMQEMSQVFEYILMSNEQ